MDNHIFFCYEHQFVSFSIICEYERNNWCSGNFKDTPFLKPDQKKTQQEETGISCMRQFAWNIRLLSGKNYCRHMLN